MTADLDRELRAFGRTIGRKVLGVLWNGAEKVPVVEDEHVENGISA